MRGFDQTTNLILDECFERVYSLKSGVEQAVLGLYIIRGDNMCVYGEGMRVGWKDSMNFADNPSGKSPIFNTPLPLCFNPTMNPDACSLIVSVSQSIHRLTVTVTCPSLSTHLFHRAVIGELDEELDSNLDLSQIMAPPLKAIVH